MYGNKNIKHKKDGTKYKDFYYYGCKHRTMTRGHKCDYKKQIREELFAAMMQEKINSKVDIVAIDGELMTYEKQLRQYYAVKLKLAEEIDTV